MVAVLEELSQRFDMVVVAAPALLPLPDARLLARHTDGVVVAVRAGRSTDQQVTDALKALADSGGKLLGTVLVNVGVGEHFAQARAASYDAGQSSSWSPPASSFDPGPLLGPSRLEGYRPTTEPERVSDGS
jgi:Mrp family chromosome partitioning ATPase